MAVDIDDLDQPSLEEVVVKIEYNRVMLSAKDEKESTLARLRQLNEVYNQIMKRQVIRNFTPNVLIAKLDFSETASCRNPKGSRTLTLW